MCGAGTWEEGRHSCQPSSLPKYTAPQPGTARIFILNNCTWCALFGRHQHHVKEPDERQDEQPEPRHYLDEND